MRGGAAERRRTQQRQVGSEAERQRKGRDENEYKEKKVITMLKLEWEEAKKWPSDLAKLFSVFLRREVSGEQWGEASPGTPWTQLCKKLLSR